jgi:xylose isomerase
MNSSSLESIYQKVKAEDINPQPQSGRQEYLENLLNSFIE